ncbi:MAG: T9SS type A sorting domain-containing protein [Bacteroidia bacterium]
MKRKFYILLIVLFCLNGISGFAQNETNIWCFGLGAGLDFNSGSPVFFSGSATSTNEGCSSIADASGNLLFYTDGMNVWNRNHIGMPNGSGLMGDYSASQSAVIVKQPGNANIYFIFTAGAWGGPSIYYNTVDMTLNGGLGDVVLKNQFMCASSTEKICAVKHANGTDFWILSHEYMSDRFFAFQLSSAGVSAAPVITGIGCIASDAVGCMKGSGQGNRVAIAHRNDTLQVFDFNNASGVFSSPITLSNFTSVTGYSAYGVEFSPNGRFLYAAEEEYYVPCNLYQYDLNAGSNAAIEASRTIIGVDYPDHSFGSLQLGPDHKIYVARNNASVIGVINNPDFLAPSCNYDSLGVNIFPATCYLGLPNEYVNSVISPTLAAFTSPTSVCPGGCVAFSNLSANATSYQWSFPGANPSSSTDENPSQICYSTPGQYTVTLIASNSVYSDTTTIINYINVNPIPQLGLPGHSNDTMFMSGGYVSFQWYMNSQIIPGATDSFYVATQDGLYYVEVVDSNGCQGTSAYLDLAVGIASLQTTHEFRLFPNPVKNDFTLKFNSDKSQYISIEVRDVVGQLIYSDQYSALPGLNSIHIPSSDWAEGTYYLRSLTAKESDCLKLEILR